ncbi:MAG TPA: amidohydrolase family protein [Cyclobacteriaceae bacterium]|nr:amidohydrolase family protein [Cyclobacteriaceae bacterium]
MTKSTLPPMLRRIFRGLVVSMMVPAVSFAQQQQQPQDDQVLAPVTRTYAITNVNIIQGPGRKIDMGTVLIKDGLITGAGKGLAIPPEAIVIKADSMYVYAGFIDGLSRVGVMKPKEEPSRERVQNPGNPPPEKAGITPQNDVRNLLNPADKALEDYRGVGFTTAQVVPYGVLLPGYGAVIQLSGKPADEVVLSSKSSFYSELTSNQGVYPGTILGIMAKWRELYRQASLSHTYEGMYASNRAGLERPASDRVLEAFYPVIDKKTSVLFKADKILDAHRVLTLQSDLGFNLTLANLKEGWDVINKIKASNAKVFLSLDLPDEVKDEKKDAKKDAKPETINDKERVVLEQRKKDFIAKYDAQAAVFQKAGVKFGFASIDAKTANVQANLRRMIKAGLTEDQALAALTTSPAEILGMSDRLGTIDNGKIANLTVSDKPYFNEKAKVKYVFVDGQPFKMEVKEPKKDGTVKAEIVGKWSVTVETPQGKNSSTVTFTKDGSTYTGKVSGDMMPSAVNMKTVELDGTNLKYSYSFTMDGSGQINVEVDATVDGETYSGTVTAGSFGSFSLEAKKDPK